MVLPILIEVGLVAIGGAFSILDWYDAQSMSESVSQMEMYYKLIQGQTTFFDFIGQAWPSLLLIAGVLLLGFTISTPQRPKNKKRSWSN
ncbi:MAG: hypothetical protein E7Z70_02155 [Thermoplasmata archaeon]|nr:hypothetical protein [Thermoplasmata archaeon]